MKDPADELDLVKLLGGLAQVDWRAWDLIGIRWDPIEFDLPVICVEVERGSAKGRAIIFGVILLLRM